MHRPDADRRKPTRFIAVSCIMAVLLSPALSGCVSTGAPPSSEGPRYTQPGIGAPTRQTDLFGNSVLP